MSAPVYFIAHLQVTDADEYRKYEKGFFPVLKDYDAKFITFDDDVVLHTHLQMTGEWHLYETGQRWRDEPGAMRALVEVDGFQAQDHFLDKKKRFPNVKKQIK